MLNKNLIKKIEVKKRIIEELLSLLKNPVTSFGLTVSLPNEDNILEWEAKLMGPNDTSYKDGIFVLKVEFPKDYPMKPPEIFFKTPIYHLNVNPKISDIPEAKPLGHICISTLNWWKPEFTMREVFSSIFALFYMGNPDNPYSFERAEEYKNNQNLFQQKVKYFTQKYANPLYANIHQDYNESWNFDDYEENL